MRKKTVAFAVLATLLVFGLGFLALRWLPSEGRPSQEPDPRGPSLVPTSSPASAKQQFSPSYLAQLQKLAGRIRPLAAQKGDGYLKGRNELVRVAKADPRPFVDLVKTTGEWKVRVLCSILLERVQQPDAVRQFEEWKPTGLWRRGTTDRVSSYAGGIAEKGAGVPMLLVERLWKGDLREARLRHWRYESGTEIRASMAVALGRLKAAAAREVMEMLLLEPYDRFSSMLDREMCAWALGQFRDPRSIPALIAAFDIVPASEHPSRGADLESIAEAALQKCASRKSLPLLEAAYRKATSKDQGLALFRTIRILKGLPPYTVFKELWGYVDRKGQLVTRLEYVNAWGFVGGMGRVELKNGRMKALNEAGEPLPFDHVGFQAISEGLMAASNGSKGGYIDRDGKVVVPFQFEFVEPFSMGLARVKLGGKWGLIDKTGKMVIKPQFDRISLFHDGMAVVVAGTKAGFVSAAGQLVVPPKYGDWTGFSEGLAGVSVRGKWGFIDKTGRMVIEPQYDSARRFAEGRAAAQLNNKWGFVGKAKGFAISPRYAEVGNFSNGLARVKSGDKWGYISLDSRVAIEPRFDEATDFRHPVTAVRIGTKWGFIDKSGKMLLKPQFSQVHEFYGRFCVVELDDKSGFVDQSGKLAIRPRFAIAHRFSHGLAAVSIRRDVKKPWGVEQEMVWGYIDTTGRMVIKPQFYRAKPFPKSGPAAVAVRQVVK
jgi:WG repeat protein/PBS lyase HEAT-like repeat-containing protein